MDHTSLNHEMIVSAVTTALSKAGGSTGLPGRAVAPYALFDVWISGEREKPPVERYQRDAEALFRRLAVHLAEKRPDLVDLRTLDRTGARDFLKAEFSRGIAPKTYNNHLILLRSAFTEVVRECGTPNPFAGLKRKHTDMIGRDCFSEHELAKILTAAKQDELIGAPVIVAAMTAMRRGDCCLLKMRSVDFERRMIRVKTRKTGKLVWIPMFDLLHGMLKKSIKGRILKADDYLFPGAAAMYKDNPDGISWRFRLLLRQAGVRGDDELEPIEELGPRVRKPSRRGFHAFRTTWVTLALNHGVSEPMILDIAGIRTLQVARTNYYRPSVESYDYVLTAKLPTVLKNGSVSRGSASAAA